jgi:hypothetical protein
MSIEDINYLKNNSIKQNYTFLIDSTDRDRDKYPNPNKYVVDFTVPFKNVIGMEIIDASIPRTMYNIDVENNLLYYYLGNDENDTIIKNGVSEKIACDIITSNCTYADGYTKITDGGYIELSNNINIYNIYSNHTTGQLTNAESNSSFIGGTEIGITYSFKIKAEAIYNSLKDNTYCVFSLGYYHLWKQTKEKYTGMSVSVVKRSSGTLYNIQFIMGDGSIAGDTHIISNVDLGAEVHICWTIFENNWNIYISNNSLSVNIATSITVAKTIKNVFYVRKYIGKSLATPITNNLYGNIYKESWTADTNAVMYIKDFKIYNRALRADEVILCKNNNITDMITNMPFWYKLYDNSTKNSGKTELINYPDIFNKMAISTGDYTLKTFLLNYEEIEDSEIGFKKHSEPAELTNLIDIYSRLPFVFDMGRSTIYENLGFDLYNSINPDYINDRYQYKAIYNKNPNMYKMFHSILNKTLTKVINTIEYDKNLITSPGIVYLIGNKYIVLKCPEIEEHLFGSLSYSKYSLGLAKFRVDNIGINSERLAITKLPVREFHPIGKLSRISLRFETNRGTLYDFKGVNHNIVFAIYYYEPKQIKFPEGSILNPEYKMNYIDYKYYQEEIEGDSEDETEEYSRDNINDYKKKEIDYSNEGIKLRQYNEHYVNKDDSEDEDGDA